MQKTIVMSVGGSLVAPDQIDINFLKKFRALIFNYIKKGNRVIIITGGGNAARQYQQALSKIDSKATAANLDWVGIAGTKINAELVRAMFGQIAYKDVIGDPAVKVKTNKKIIIGAGWVPGHSSDNDAVIIAKTYGAQTVINLSNIKYVYDKDPKKFKNAKPQKEMTWKEFRKIVGNKWIPGAHLPFDPVASKLAANSKMELVVMEGTNLVNLKNFLDGKKFVGTIVK